MKELPIITLDGPAGSGKSSVTRNLAEKLNLTFIDTGAMFRVLSLVLWEKFERRPLIEKQSDQFIDYLNRQKFEYQPRPEVLVAVNEVDYSQKIRENFVSGITSDFSQLAWLRDFCVHWQKKIVQSDKSWCIVEGRDTGSVVFPKAMLKFYLTADSEVRAKRRLQELQEKGLADGLALEELREQIEQRDQNDQNRKISPLQIPPDAQVIDTSQMTYEHVLMKLEQEILKKVRTCSAKKDSTN